MKKLLILLLSALSLTAFAQQPKWYDEAQRATNYPKSSYFTGMAYGEVKRGESEGAAMERLKNAARVETTSTINARVQSETTSDIHSESIETLDEWAESIRETMDIHSTITVDLEIPGLEAEAWKNPNSNEVVAFAYVKKSTLIRQLEKKITVGLTKVETTLDQVEEMISQGQKVQAREAINKALPLFQEIEQAQRILVAVDPTSDTESLQLAETKQQSQRFIHMAADLKHGINIFLSCNADMLGQKYMALKGEIVGELSKMGCTFVPTADKSDWAVYIDANAREYRKTDYGTTSSYFSYVDVNISIDKTPTGQRIYENAISEKGGDTQSFVQAARVAYKDISPKLSEIIKQQIQQ